MASTMESNLDRLARCHNNIQAEQRGTAVAIEHFKPAILLLTCPRRVRLPWDSIAHLLSQAGRNCSSIYTAPAIMHPKSINCGKEMIGRLQPKFAPSVVVAIEFQ